MSFTRCYYDEERTQNTLNILTNTGRYNLIVPGNGTNMPFQEDVYCRLQKWGGNLHPNILQIEDVLHNRNHCQHCSSDCKCQLEQNRDNFKKYSKNGIQYKSVDPYTDHSRITNPAWEIRDVVMEQWKEPINTGDFQKDLEPVVSCNLQTRTLEKDQHN